MVYGSVRTGFDTCAQKEKIEKKMQPSHFYQILIVIKKREILLYRSLLWFHGAKWQTCGAFKCPAFDVSVVFFMEVSGWLISKPSPSCDRTVGIYIRNSVFSDAAVAVGHQYCCQMKQTWWHNQMPHDGAAYVSVTKWRYFKSYGREWVGRRFLLTLFLGNCRLHSVRVLDILALDA